jgi:hypothetical protein
LARSKSVARSNAPVSAITLIAYRESSGFRSAIIRFAAHRTQVDRISRPVGGFRQATAGKKLLRKSAAKFILCLGRLKSFAV